MRKKKRKGKGLDQLQVWCNGVQISNNSIKTMRLRAEEGGGTDTIFLVAPMEGIKTLEIVYRVVTDEKVRA